ncbi:N-acetyl sugar amidotransferase [Litorivicinus sp.]|nr:N-acetyl sugar amidotransferase [Litorivicinus sp.]
MKILRPKSLDFEGFGSGRVKYGLPEIVQFCSKCVISNQRPNSAHEFKNTGDSKKATINISAGVCDACFYAEKKDKEINWSERERELWELCDRYRANDGSYDCLVPGSGGKDSFFTAHILKTKFRMNPLTVTWSPNIYTEWGRSNFDSWIHAGFDNYLVTPNGAVHRLLTRLALEKLLHPFQPFMLGQKALPPKLASTFGIPLVFYGENEAEYGNPIADNSASQRDWEYFAKGSDEDVYISGVSLQKLAETFDIAKRDLNQYLPLDYERIKASGLAVHYLGYYLKWHPQGCYYYSMANSDFEPAPYRTPGTYSKYTSIDDKLDDLHFYTTGIKFGLGRASYEASQEVRNGDITRADAVSLVKKFDHEFPSRFIEEILTYLSIDEKTFGSKVCAAFEQPIMDKDYFRDLCDSFRSPHIWRRVNAKWDLVHQVS